MKRSCPEITFKISGQILDLRKIPLEPSEVPLVSLEPIELSPAASSYVEMIELCDREITKALLGPLPQAVATNFPPSLIQGLAHIAYTEAKMKEHWQHFMSAYAIPRPELQKPKRPKWGQRGRHRLRKTRLEARAINHLMNDLRRRLQCPKPSSLLTMEPNQPPVA